MKKENWIVACGGKEPIMTIEGKQYQYYYETISGIHAYYNLTDDIFHTEGLNAYLPNCLKD